MARRNKTTTVSASRRSLPARNAKTMAIASLTELNKTENNPIAEDDELAVGVDEESIQVFTTFKTKTNLDDGIYVVRNIGNGDYKAVNLSTVADGAMGSQTTGSFLMQDQALMKLLNITQKAWDDARVKCSQAVMSAGEFTLTCSFDIAILTLPAGEIFYFRRLPTELQFSTYTSTQFSHFLL